MEQRTIASFFFLALLIGTLVVMGFMLKPFLSMLFVAGVLTLLLSGVNRRLTRKLGSPTFAALITTIGALIVILVPLAFLVWQAVQEASALYTLLQSHATPAVIMHLVDIVRDRISSIAPWLTFSDASVTAAIRSALGWTVGHTGAIFAGIGTAALNTFMLLFVLFFFLRDSAKLKRAAMNLSPLSDKHEQQILTTISRIVSSTVRGKVLISFIQGIVAGLGFWFFAIPSPALWGGAVMLASFLPSIGSALVVIPIVAYLFTIGNTSSAIGLSLFCILVVSMIDNVLGPKLMSHGTQIHPLLMFLAVLGGVSLFGPLGILLGPVVMAFLQALFEIYGSLVKHS